ncbi:MAG: hypothetical protein LBS60_11180 [Deltaproteobacteria bacterium]|jgi:hypothetical protein|nr:hypothetical protein [Deltaproteobacteria bacterium]
MKKINQLIASIILIFSVFCFNTLNSSAEIIPEDGDILQNKLDKIWKTFETKVNPPSNQKYPHRVIGLANEEINDFIKSEWNYKAVTYELYYENSSVLARQIYQLAIFTKDIDKTITIEKLEKGLQGYHYGLDQVTDWLNNSKLELYSREELEFLLYLLIDNVVKYEDGHFSSTGKARHILGVAPGSKRSMKSVVAHERLHVIWDEEPAVKKEYLDKWSQLTPEEKDEVAKTLKSYSKEKESQLIEEWAVREMEKKLSN